MKKTSKKQPAIKCPYCHSTAILTPARKIYGPDTKEEWLYVCSHYPECNSYVGVHKGTKRPMGTLANGDLRNKRIKAHKMFDLIWRSNVMNRKNAYRWMSDKLCIPSEHAHIGCFSEYMCDQLIDACKDALANNKISYSHVS